jgi:hypothetical protein
MASSSSSSAFSPSSAPSAFSASPTAFREPGAARAGGYVLALAGILIALGLVFHPVPAGGFEEKPSVLMHTPWWGPIHIAIAAGFVLVLLGSVLMLVAGGRTLRSMLLAFSWAAMAVGMVFFTGVALVNGWVMHYLTSRGAPATDPLLYDAFNRLLIGYGWLGNPLFLLGLTGVTYAEVRSADRVMPGWLAWVGLVAAVLSWGRGIGSATGLYFLEPLIFANVPAFLWLGYYGWQLGRSAEPPLTHVLQG